MAEIQQQENRHKRGGIRSKKLSTRVDLTPMVDLGFLLITFFIFTTTMSEANGLSLVVPQETPPNEPPTLTPESKTISLILNGDDVIHYYQGLNMGQTLSTNYSVSGLRSIIRQKMEAVKKRFGANAEVVVLIKPTDGATYKNIVNVLDEMLINNVKKYVLVEASPEEKTL